jgi:hypothetical protein
LEVKNPNLMLTFPMVSIHWIDGQMVIGQFQNGTTTEVLPLFFDYAKMDFLGKLTALSDALGQKIMTVNEDIFGDVVSSQTYPNQIAVQIGADQWLDDSVAHADRHNFNLDLGKSFQAQGGEYANCYLRTLE